jgi:hypothetical protein
MGSPYIFPVEELNLNDRESALLTGVEVPNKQFKDAIERAVRQVLKLKSHPIRRGEQLASDKLASAQDEGVGANVGMELNSAKLLGANVDRSYKFEIAKQVVQVRLQPLLELGASN